MPFPFQFRARYALAAAYILVPIVAMKSASATPQFARQTKLPCSACHSTVPQLNAFGQTFYANGFRIPGHEKDHEKPQWTIPFWADIEAVAETSKSLGNTVPVQWDCTLIASFGYLDSVGLLYHAEWLPVDNNTFIYGIERIGNRFSLAAGQLEMISQYDPLLDISPTQPEYLSPNGSGYTGVPGIYGPFSPAGAAYGARAVWSLQKDSALPYADGWKVAATVPFGDEVAYGLAQPKWQHTPTGAFFETYYRSGMSSYGVNSFFGKDGRHYYGALVQRKEGAILLQAGAAYDQFAFGHTNLAGAGIEWPIAWNAGLGFRVDDEDGFIKYVPTISFLVGGHRSAARLVVESEFTRSGQPLTTITADVKF